MKSTIAEILQILKVLKIGLFAEEKTAEEKEQEIIDKIDPPDETTDDLREAYGLDPISEKRVKDEVKAGGDLFDKDLEKESKELNKVEEKKEEKKVEKKEEPKPPEKKEEPEPKKEEKEKEDIQENVKTELAKAGDKVIEFDKLETAVKEFYPDYDKLSVPEKIVKIKEFKDTKEFKQEFVEEKKVDTKPIKIGKIEYTYAELEEKTKEYFSDTDFTKLNAEQKAKYVQAYINSKHFKEGKASIDRKHQEIADKSKKLDEERQQLQGELDDVQNKLDKLEKAKKEKEDIINKKIDMEAEDFDEGKVAELRTEKILAKSELEKMNRYEEALMEEFNNNYYAILTDNLQIKFPELMTSEPFERIITKVDESGMGSEVPEEEYKKASLIEKILKDYLDHLENKPNAKITIEDYFQFNKSNYPSYSAIAQSVPEEKGNKKEKEPEIEEELDLSSLNSKQQVDLLIKRQGETPPPPKGKTETSTDKFEEKKDEGDKLSLESSGYGEPKI